MNYEEKIKNSLKTAKTVAERGELNKIYVTPEFVKAGIVVDDFKDWLAPIEEINDLISDYSMDIKYNRSVNDWKLILMDMMNYRKKLPFFSGAYHSGAESDYQTMLAEQSGNISTLQYKLEFEEKIEKNQKEIRREIISIAEYLGEDKISYEVLFKIACYVVGEKAKFGQ